MRKNLISILPLAFIWACFGSVADAAPKAGPFELWPATPDSAPVPYSKAAPPYDAKGKAWNFPSGKDASVLIRVDASKTLHRVTPYHFGANLATWDRHDWLLRPDIVEKARQAGIRFWRWPGGNASDDYHWDGDYSWHKEVQGWDPSTLSDPPNATTDDFVKFCRATGSQAIIAVNYAAARYGTLKQGVDLAARWVKNLNFTKKFKVLYWEIGNEVYGSWQRGYHVEGKKDLRGNTYGRDLKPFAAAMKKADPDIYIGAVGFSGEGEKEWDGHFSWMKGLLPYAQRYTDFMIEHNYFGYPYKDGKYVHQTHQEIFDTVKMVAGSKKSIEGMTAKYAPGTRPLPIAFTEFNMINGSPEPTITLLNGLFTAEVLGEHIQAGYKSSNYWDWRNGLDKKEKGDHGMLSNEDPAIPNWTPRPTYYTYALYDRAFGDRMVGAKSSEADVKVYASRFSGGEVGLVLVNEREKPRSVTVKVSGAKPKGRVLGWVLTGRNLDSKRVSWNGVEGPAGGGGPFPLNTIPAYRAEFDPSKPLVLDIPANSVSGVVIY